MTNSSVHDPLHDNSVRYGKQQKDETVLEPSDHQTSHTVYDSTLPGFEPFTGPETPTILRCDIEGCDTVYLGGDRRADLVRHRRQTHQGPYPQYTCEDYRCDQAYRTLDARLAHYGRDHPHLALGFSSRLRKLSTSMTNATLLDGPRSNELLFPDAKKPQSIDQLTFSESQSPTMSLHNSTLSLKQADIPPEPDVEW